MVAIIGFFGWSTMSFMRPRFATKKEFADLQQKTNEIEKDVDEIKSTIKSLATKKDIAEIEQRVAEINTTTKATHEGLKRLEGYFLEKGVNKEV